MLLELHSILSSRKVYPILLIPTETPSEGDPGVESDRSAVGIGEATITCSTVRVTTRTICLVSDTLSHVVNGGELLPCQSIWRPVDIG